MPRVIPASATTWKGPVATVGDLPATGEDGEARVVLDNGGGVTAIYIWDSNTMMWTAAGGGGSTDAVDINITDAGGYYTGTEVETALQEVGADLAALGPYGNVITVATSNGDYATVDAAIAAAGSGDIIRIMPGTYTVTPDTTLPTGLKAIIGAGQEAVTLQFSGATAFLFEIDTPCLFSHMTLEANTGAGVTYAFRDPLLTSGGGHITVEYVTFSRVPSGSGGDIYNFAPWQGDNNSTTDATFSHCYFKDCQENTSPLGSTFIHTGNDYSGTVRFEHCRVEQITSSTGVKYIARVQGGRSGSFRPIQVFFSNCHFIGHPNSENILHQDSTPSPFDDPNGDHILSFTDCILENYQSITEGATSQNITFVYDNVKMLSPTAFSISRLRPSREDNCRMYIRGVYIDEEKLNFDTMAPVVGFGEEPELDWDFSLYYEYTSSPVTMDAWMGFVDLNQVADAAFSITLPRARYHCTGEITIRDLKGDAGTNNVTILPGASDTIEGGASYVISDDDGWVTLKRGDDGTAGNHDWRVIGKSTTPVPYGNVITVATSGGDYSDFDSAFAAVTAGDIIRVMPGTYALGTMDDTLPAGLTAIVGAGPNEVILTATGMTSHVWTTNGDITISGMTWDNDEPTGAGLNWLEIQNGDSVVLKEIYPTSADPTKSHRFWEVQASGGNVTMYDCISDNLGRDTPFESLGGVSEIKGYRCQFKQETNVIGTQYLMRLNLCAATSRVEFHECLFVGNGFDTNLLLAGSNGITYVFRDCELQRVDAWHTSNVSTDNFEVYDLRHDGDGNSQTYKVNPNGYHVIKGFSINGKKPSRDNFGIGGAGDGELDWDFSFHNEYTSSPATMTTDVGFATCNQVAAGAFAITLPKALDHCTGEITIRDTKGDAAENPITITRASADTIEGNTTYVIGDNYGWVTLKREANTTNFDWKIVASSSPPGTAFTDTQIITVAKAGGDFTSIKSAMDSISDATSAKPYVIQVLPGVYAEDNPITGQDYVSIHCPGRHESTIMTCDNAGSNGINMGNNTDIVGLQIQGASTSGSAAFYIAAGKEDIEWHDCKIKDCDIGWHSETNVASPNIFCRDADIETGTCTSIFKASAGGLMNVVGAFVSNPVTATHAFHVDGSGSTIRVVGCRINGTNTTNGVYAENGGLAVLNSSHFRNLTIGARTAATGGTIRAVATTIEDPTTGVQCGANGRIDCDAVRLSGTTTDIITDAATSVVTWSGGEVDSTKITRFTGSRITAMYLEGFAGDLGTSIIGEFHVGRPDDPAETCLGGGDSHTIGMAAQTNTNGEAGSWVDETADAVSDSGSTVTVFPGTGAENSLYIGGDSEFPGLKLDVTTVITLGGSGAIALEYWNGASWAALECMVTKATAPYTQYGETLFGNVQEDQIRFGDTTGWATKSLNSVTKYWIRFRVTTAITTSPVIEQAKLHTDRMEFNADGFQERFGAARKVVDVIWHRNIADSISGSAPASENLDVSANIVLGAQANKFANSAEDSIGGALIIPDGMDTSHPIVFDVDWYSDVTTGNVELEVDYSYVSIGDTLDGTIAEISLADIAAVPGTSETLTTTQFELDISPLVPGDYVAFRLFRDATVGNGDDTAAGAVVLWNFRATGTFWN
jgi:hypothetical protein